MQTNLSREYIRRMGGVLTKHVEESGRWLPTPGEGGAEASKYLQGSSQAGIGRAAKKLSDTREKVEAVLRRTKPSVEETVRFPKQLERMGEQAKELALLARNSVSDEVANADPDIAEARLQTFAAGDLAGQGVAVVERKADAKTGHPARKVRIELDDLKRRAKDVKERAAELAGEGDRGEAIQNMAAAEMRVMREGAKKFIENTATVEVSAAKLLRRAERFRRQHPK